MKGVQKHMVKQADGVFCFLFGWLFTYFKKYKPHTIKQQQKRIRPNIDHVTLP